MAIRSNRNFDEEALSVNLEDNWRRFESNAVDQPLAEYDFDEVTVEHRLTDEELDPYAI